MTKHEADVISGLNMTDQISNEAYKQIMIAAQDEKEVGAVLDNLRADIESYEADCILADDSKECKECDKIVFGSIYRIIDRYRNEVNHETDN